MRPQKIQFDNHMPIQIWFREINHIPYHWHETLEIILVQHGHIHICFGPEEQRLDAGDLAVVNINETHRIYNTSPGNRVVQIQLDPQYGQRHDPDFTSLLFYCCSKYEGSQYSERYESFKDALLSFVQCQIQQNAHLPGHDTWDRNEIRQQLDTIIQMLIHDFDYLRWGTGFQPFDDTRRNQLQKISTYLKFHFSEKLTLSDISQVAGIGPHHFSHLITEQFHFSVFELLTYHRMEEAVKLLLTTPMRIVDISNECGFSDVKYLVQAFKKNYNCTPSAFRKRYQVDDVTLASQIRYWECPDAEFID